MSFLARLLGGGGSQAATVASSTTRAVAKERLSVILASQRGSELLEGVCMEELQRDVLQVVERHINVAKNRPVHFSFNSEGNIRLFEMSVELEGRRGQIKTTL